MEITKCSSRFNRTTAIRKLDRQRRDRGNTAVDDLAAIFGRASLSRRLVAPYIPRCAAVRNGAAVKEMICLCRQLDKIPLESH